MNAHYRKKGRYQETADANQFSFDRIQKNMLKFSIEELEE
jgi:hypothetical protein